MPQKPKLLTPHLSAYDRFGAELRARRIRHGLSQAALARTVHVHPDLIAKVEKAVRRPTRTLAAACDEALAADGVLIGFWLLTGAAGSGGPANRAAPALAPIGEVAADADPAAPDHPRQNTDERTAVIRLDARRYGAADLAGLEHAESIEVLWHALREGAAMSPDECATATEGAAAEGTTAELSRLGSFAIPATRRPYRLTFTRCALLGVAGIEVRVRGLDAPTGATVYDLWPCAVTPES